MTPPPPVQQNKPPGLYRNWCHNKRHFTQNAAVICSGPCQGVQFQPDFCAVMNLTLICPPSWIWQLQIDWGSSSSSSSSSSSQWQELRWTQCLQSSSSLVQSSSSSCSMRGGGFSALLVQSGAPVLLPLRNPLFPHQQLLDVCRKQTDVMIKYQNYKYEIL